MTELPMTQEMVLLCAFLRISLRAKPKRVRKRMMREMSEFMAQLAQSDAWTAHVMIDKADEARLEVRRSAAGHWAIIRQALERELG